jgi:hypothetical protein
MKLNDLRNDPTLLEDVWISPCIGEVPRWLEDPEARDGIRALLKCDRCQEEQHRLGREADNMCRWFGRELAAIELALRQPQCMSSIQACFHMLNPPTDSVYGSLLRQRRESIQNLQDRWPNVLASPARYSSQARIAIQLAISLSGGSSPPELQWLDPVVLTLADECQAEEDAEDVTPPGDTVDDIFDSGTAVLQDVLVGSVPDESDEEDNDNEEPLNVHIEWRIPPVRHIPRLIRTVLRT